MARLQPDRLHVTFALGARRDEFSLPRCYTLTHSDLTGNLYLTIGPAYDLAQIRGFYTRLMRDEVLAEWRVDETGPQLLVHCHISGGIVFGWPGLRAAIFRREMPLVLESIRYGDREMIKKHPVLDKAPIRVHFHSNKPRHDRVERWATLSEYCVTPSM